MTKVLASPVENTRSQGFTRFIDAIRKRGIAEHVVLVTTLPGGGLRVCRSSYLGNSTISQYAESLHLADSAAWNSILKGHTTSGSSPLGDRMQFVLGVGLDNPVLPGYAGAVLLFNSTNTGKQGFNELDEAQAIRELASMYLGTRINGHASKTTSQIIISENHSIITPFGKVSPFDEVQTKQLVEIATNLKSTQSQRVAIKGIKGIQTHVSVTRFESYRSLGSGPRFFVSLYPLLESWQSISCDKVESDPEMARLVKSIHFITDNFKTSPTLESIAESVGLSQFHFHRRFSEIFGVTPKHVLFDLQVEESKRQLAINGKQLSEIASNCGFAHQSHFTCRFKQNTGITPTRWRVLNGLS